MVEIPSEIYALVNELLASVDERTGIVKFPKQATEIVKKLSSYAQSTFHYHLDGPMLEGWSPENIWTEILLHRLASENSRHRAMAVIIRAPALEKALAEQRRCRVCGCTEENACIPSSCYWVEADLCSECVGKE